jgi:hypothetical protein
MNPISSSFRLDSQILYLHPVLVVHTSSLIDNNIVVLYKLTDEISLRVWHRSEQYPRSLLLMFVSKQRCS